MYTWPSISNQCKSREGLHLRPDVLSVFDKCDIFCIQETWFAVQDLHVVNNLHSKFHGFGVSTTDYKDGLVSGHPPGGVAIFGVSILIRISSL